MGKASNINLNTSYIYLRGEQAIRKISREELLSGRSADGMHECCPAEERDGMIGVWPGSAVYLRDGCVIGSSLTVCDSQFRFIEESLTLNYQAAAPFHEKVYNENKEKPIVDLPGWWVCLANWSYHNYYHWFAQCLACIEIVDRLSIPHDYSILVPKLKNWQRNTLVAAGIDLSRVKEISQEVYRCEHLIYPSDLRNQPEAVSGRMVSVMKKIRRNVLANHTPDVIYPKIYLARFDSLNRILKNEGEIIDRLRERGYWIVTSELIDFFQKVLIFAHTKIVIGANGAGMTSIAYAEKGTKVIELNPLVGRRTFRDLSVLCELDHTVVEYPRHEPGSDVKPWRIDDVPALIARIAEVEAAAGL